MAGVARCEPAANAPSTLTVSGRMQDGEEVRITGCGGSASAVADAADGRFSVAYAVPAHDPGPCKLQAVGATSGLHAYDAVHFGGERAPSGDPDPGGPGSPGDPGPPQSSDSGSDSGSDAQAPPRPIS